jgi:Peptidase A4 family
MPCDCNNKRHRTREQDRSDVRRSTLGAARRVASVHRHRIQLLTPPRISSVELALPSARARGITSPRYAVPTLRRASQPIHNPSGAWSGVKVVLSSSDQKKKHWINYVSAQWTIPNVGITDQVDPAEFDTTPFLLSTWIGFGTESAFLSVGVDISLTFDLINGNTTTVTPWAEEWFPDSPGPVMYEFLDPQLAQPTFPETSVSTAVGDLVKASLSLDSTAPINVGGIEYSSYLINFRNITQDFAYASALLTVPTVQATQAAWVVEPLGPSLSDTPVYSPTEYNFPDAPLFPTYGQVFFDDALCGFSDPQSLFGAGLLQPLSDGTPGYLADQHGRILSKAHAHTNTCIQCWNPQNDSNHDDIFQVPKCLPDAGPAPLFPNLNIHGQHYTLKHGCIGPHEYKGYEWLFKSLT